MPLLRRSGVRHAFALAMIGPKMGDRLVQLGAGDGGMLAALGSKVGLTGRACGVDASDAGLARAQEAADREGVLVELQRAPYTALPYDESAFDVAVVNGVLRDAAPDPRSAIARETARVLRSGGRCIVVDPVPRGGLGALLGGAKPDPTYQPDTLLRDAGFRAVRVLAERDGLRFVEGIITRNS
jgi:ubiquinone/menaquinone biosynthesis C-methylase UbiE